MTIAHIFIVHALYGAFFGWLGIVGSLAPDSAGIVGWVRYIRSDIKIAGNDWYDYMTEGARQWYRVMHSMQAFGIVLIVELFCRYTLNFLLFGLHGFNASMQSLWPFFAVGYLTHILSDWYTHRQDMGDIILWKSGVPIGVNWYESRYYWTELAGAGLCITIALCGPENVLFDFVLGLL